MIKFIVEIDDDDFTEAQLKSVLHDGFTEGYGYNANNWPARKVIEIDPYREILDMLTSGEHGGRTEAYEATVKYLESKAGPVQDKPRIQIPEDIYTILYRGLSRLESADNSMSGNDSRDSEIGIAWLDENCEIA